ncbi:hypothetical protein [Neobacillus ginsengisoli]|uniref:hypothetical protein n=1 Tax=Neobacillus ginsengisoli TaxID=904295 RepID=UPI003520FCEF
MSLRTLYSEEKEEGNKVTVKACLHSETKKDTVVEEIVGSISLEKEVTAIGWKLVTVPNHIIHSDEL